MFRRGELLGRFIARKLSGWSDKRYNQEYWGRLKRNQRWWKGKQSEKRKIETIKEREEIEKEKSRVREWTEEDDDEMGNMVNPYYELQENSLGQGNLRGRWCHDLAKQLSGAWEILCDKSQQGHRMVTLHGVTSHSHSM